MPIPGAVGFTTAILAALVAVFAGAFVSAAITASAVVAGIIWLVVFTRISAPINRLLIEADVNDRPADGTRALQNRWDRVINLRVALQGYIVLALGVAIALL